MNNKLVELNLHAQESLALKGNYKKELQELIKSDISQEEIKEYRHKYPDLSYVFNKLEKEGLLFVIGISPQLLQRKNEGLEYSKKLENMLDDFVKWKPDYTMYDIDDYDGIDFSFNTKSDIAKIGRLQGARVSQIRLIKKIIEQRRKETEFYFGDKDVVGELDDLPYHKYEKLKKMIEDNRLTENIVEEGECEGLIKEIANNFEQVKAPYSFTRCLEKARIRNKKWSRVVNGTKALNTDIYLALALTFYLGIDTLEDVEIFLNCFGISLNSPCEVVNTVPISEIKEAIEAGIHYDNILYYLRMSQD